MTPVPAAAAVAQAPLARLQAPIEPFKTGMLDVGDGHRVYWELCGNPSGKRGVVTPRREELRWYCQEGASWLFPDEWERFLAPIPQNERHDLMAAYRRRLTGTDK